MSDRVVETQFGFDRLAATDVSVAYRVLVPERGVRVGAAGAMAQKERVIDDERGDLRPGVEPPPSAPGYATATPIPVNTASSEPGSRSSPLVT